MHTYGLNDKHPRGFSFLTEDTSKLGLDYVRYAVKDLVSAQYKALLYGHNTVILPIPLQHIIRVTILQRAFDERPCLMIYLYNLHNHYPNVGKLTLSVLPLITLA